MRLTLLPLNPTAWLLKLITTMLQGPCKRRALPLQIQLAVTWCLWARAVSVMREEVGITTDPEERDRVFYWGLRQLRYDMVRSFSLTSQCLVR